MNSSPDAFRTIGRPAPSSDVDGEARRRDDAARQPRGKDAIAPLTPDERVAVCRALLRLDAAAQKLLGTQLLAHASWISLLELYVAGQEGKMMFQSCLTIDEAPSNVHRRSARLARLGALLRSPDPRDNRRTGLRLAPAIRAALDRLMDILASDIPSSEGRLQDRGAERRCPSTQTGERRPIALEVPEIGKIRHARLAAGGRVALPAQFRRALGLQYKDTVVLLLEDNEIRLRSARDTLQRTRERLRAFAPGEEPLPGQRARSPHGRSHG